MDLLNLNPISYYKFLLIGDSFLDVYLEDNINIFKGGVLNVEENVKLLTDKKYELKTSKKPKCLNFFKKNKKVWSETNTKEFIPSEIVFTKVTTISDYNKGCLNQNMKIHSQIVIVDSKYCTTPKNHFESAKIKILKLASTDVFNTEFIELFDYFIVTDPLYINLFFNKKLIYSWKNKEKKSICTIGAGDVFIASLTVSLYNCFRQFELSDLISAIELANYYATNSVAAPFTCRIKEI
jgi:bifunctional ADP-heptose synthase (sugar kinase/adenylyltransferase)